MSNVFFEEIKDWDTWGRVFQDIPAFEKLINRIFEKENINYKEVSHLTAGTNAVFKVDNFVVKIFAPVESGFNTEIDYNYELIGMKRATSLGINIPKVIATSYVEDKYLFRYIIMEHIEGKEAKDVLKDYSINEKVSFVHQLKENLSKMNTSVEASYPDFDVKERALSNTRWNVLPEKVVSQVKALVKGNDISNKVYVHGDITGDNVMISREGKLYIIDFADGRIAPKQYEFPPILFDLFDFDEIMMKEFIGELSIEDFVEDCFYGLLLHEFGAYFVKLICERVIGKLVNELEDIAEVKEALFKLFASFR
jgi:tRNA A-37 threonylcarbamoyl transferase component Bud32